MQLLKIIHEIRQDHPTMGVRDMFYKIRPETMGRDSFERFCREYKLMSHVPKSFRRTTDSTGVIRFDNLIKSTTLTHIDQVWQSDITYYELNKRFYYITFIIDAFSRRIVGHHTSERMHTEQTTLPALNMALKTRKHKTPQDLIFHSDGGGQYYDKNFLALTEKNKIRNSMCEFAWENGKAERINGVIKNNYLRHKSIKSFSELIKCVDQSVQLYNSEKPHIKLKRMSPISFEQKILYSNNLTTTTSN